MPHNRIADIQDMDRDQLVAWLDAHGQAPYRAGQIFKWIYSRQVDRFADMTDLAQPVRELLAAHFVIGRLGLIERRTSRDGSVKYLFELRDGNRIESVLIPEKDHSTLCISSQVGCAQGCRFCLTATGGFLRNLSRGEILAQVRDILRETLGPRPLTNIVVMGMGEPLANYQNLVSAIETLTDGNAGLKFSTRKVTVSTAGLVSRLADLGRDTQINLAISLNATDNKTRSMLMPINRTYPLEMLLAACRTYRLKPRQRITFEYILIRDVNDTIADARRLTQLLHGIRAKVNLIPFNEHSGCDFRQPEPGTILAFQEVLTRHNYTAIIRHSKGQDISAACGQLRAERNVQ